MSLHIDDTSSTGKLSDETINQLFNQLKPEDIEQFYMAYQLWSQRQQIEQLQIQMLGLQQKIAKNAAHMMQFQPSAVALASLAQLQAYGVEDTDLLDRMLERGEEWLDHSIQLLERCEQLDLIGGDYTQWCTHALEGAYDWLDSITDPGEAEIVDPIAHVNATTDSAEVTEEQLLKKLMSEEEEVEKVGQGPTPEQKPRITQPLTSMGEQDDIRDETQKIAIIKPLNRITQPLPASDEPPILDEQLDEEEDTKQVAIVKPLKHITQPLPAADEPAMPDKQVPSLVLLTLETEQNLSTASSAITTTEISQGEPIGAESDIVATQVDMSEGSERDSHPVNIEENEIRTLDSTEQERELASLSFYVENETQQEHAMMVIEHIDPDKSENGAENRLNEENQQLIQLQDLPASKKKVPKKKQGFLRWLLAKILRR